MDYARIGPALVILGIVASVMVGLSTRAAELQHRGAMTMPCPWPLAAFDCARHR